LATSKLISNLFPLKVNGNDNPSMHHFIKAWILMNEKSWEDAIRHVRIGSFNVELFPYIIIIAIDIEPSGLYYTLLGFLLDELDLRKEALEAYLEVSIYNDTIY
jgi:hypothetical protein